MNIRQRLPSPAVLAAWACAALLLLSALGPWYREERRTDAGAWVPFGTTEMPNDVTRPAHAVKFGLLAVLAVAAAAAWPTRRRAWAIPCAVFAVAALWFRTFGLVVPASLGRGPWSSRGLGGQWLHGRDWRETVGWGEGLAFWSAVAGVVVCVAACVMLSVNWSRLPSELLEPPDRRRATQRSRAAR